MSTDDLFGSVTAPSTNPLIGLPIILPAPCRCGSEQATIGSSKGLHAAACRCTTCGGFVRWLPAEAVNFIRETINQFGPPREPIILRDITTGERPMDERKINSGVLFKNTKKTADKQPDYRGYVNVNGSDFEIAGWISQTAKAGKFLGLRVKPAEAKTGTTAATSSAVEKGFDDQIPF
jgi:hypothetical protein